MLKKSDKYNYVIVTPCKNEAWNLPNLIKSVMAQTIKPFLWVIVDDGSTDNSQHILSQLEENYDWIKIVYLEESKEYLGKHISNVYNAGFEYIKKYFDKCSVGWEYIAILDADTIPEPEYFEKLVKMLENNEKLGIASGSTCEYTENLEGEVDITNPMFWATYPFSLQDEKIRTDLPMGSARIYKKKCFEETGGCFEKVNAPDSISTVKAKIKGWETICFKEIKLIERRGLSAQGNWYGYEEKGKANYVFNFPISLVLLKSLKYSTKKPYYLGIAYISGYFKALFSRVKQVEDEEVLKYYRSVHFNTTKKYNTEIIKKKIFKK